MAGVLMNCDRYGTKWVFINKQMGRRISNKEILKCWQQFTDHTRLSAQSYGGSYKMRKRESEHV